MKTLFRLLGIVLLTLPVFAQLPAPTAYVNDYAHVLSQSTIDATNDSITKLSSDKQTQIFVAVIPSLNGESIEDYTDALFKQWKPGSKTSDRGILEVIAINDHKYRIEVGYGLEGQISDGKAGDIGRSMVPFLKKKDYDGAVTTSVNQLVTEASANDGASQSLASVEPQNTDDTAMWVAIGVFILFIVGIGVALYISDRRYKKRMAAIEEEIRKRQEDLSRTPIVRRPYVPSYIPRSTPSIPSRRTNSSTTVIPVVIPESHRHSSAASYDYDGSSSSSYDYGSSSSSSSSSFDSGWGGSSGGGGASGDW